MTETKKAVHIDAEKVDVITPALEIPAGHVVVEGPTAATPATTAPATDVRAAEVEVESQAALLSQSRRDETALRTEGQRAINLMWETTQMKLALSVIWSSLVVAAILSIFGKRVGDENVQLAAVVFLFGVANLVTGFYFGRTNHTRTSGPPQGKDER